MRHADRVDLCPASPPISILYVSRADPVDLVDLVDLVLHHADRVDLVLHHVDHADLAFHPTVDLAV